MMTCIIFIISLLGLPSTIVNVSDANLLRENDVIALNSKVINSLHQAIANLTGVNSIEELSASQIEYYENLHKHPILINKSSRSDLESLAFLTPFQIASILDYIDRNGEILSALELSSVVGIGREMALDLAYFLDFRPIMPNAPLGSRLANVDSSRLNWPNIRADASMRTGVKNEAVSSLFKANCSARSVRRGQWYDEVELALSAKEDLQCRSLLYRKGGFSAIVGNHNMHLGQGLLLWSGFNITTLSDVASFSKNPSGLMKTNSSDAKSTLNGLALSLETGNMLMSLSLSDGDLLAFQSKLYTSRSSYALNFVGQQKLSSSKLSSYSASIDAKSTLGAFTLWGEGAVKFFEELAVYPKSASLAMNTSEQKEWNFSSAAILGAYYNIGYQKTVGIRSEYRGQGFGGDRRISIGVTYPNWSVLADMRNSILKLQACTNAHKKIGEWDCSGELRLRSKCQFKDSWVHSIRLNAVAQRSNFYFQSKCEIQKGQNWSKYWSLFAGYKYDKSHAVLCVNIFDAALWAERLYNYIPDVPGSFSVKALYGKGYELAAMLRYKELALKASYINYEGPKTDVFELKLYINALLRLTEKSAKH